MFVLQIALGVILAVFILAYFDAVIVILSGLVCLALVAGVILAGLAYPTFGIAALMLASIVAAIEFYPIAKTKGIFPIKL